VDFLHPLKGVRHAADGIMKVLEGSEKESSKYLRMEGGRVLYQFTVG
jgi:hypothetical protein